MNLKTPKMTVHESINLRVEVSQDKNLENIINAA